MSQGPLILTIDIGTSSARGLLCDADGRPLPHAAAETYAIPMQLDGAATIDADALLEAVWRCVDSALAQAGERSSPIVGVAIAALSTTTMALDAAGAPLTPLLIYADARSAPFAAQLRAELDEAATHQATGCLLRAAYWPARLAWFRASAPDVWRRAAAWVTIGEYMEQRLFGSRRVSSSAASWGGLLDRERLTWHAPLLAHLGVDAAQLSPVVDASAPQRGLVEPFARRWPALSRVPWFPAIGDGAAANIGSGCDGPDRLALTVGTTGALRLALPELARVPAGLWCYRVNAELSLLGGATSEGGNVYAWLRQTLALADEAALEAALEALAPDSHGLTLLPFLAGERSPGWAGDARMTIHGISAATTPQHIARAALESVAYRFALIARQIAAGGALPATIVASGGALTRSPVWMQIIADALGQTVRVSDEPEATARGAALLALLALGLRRDGPALLGVAFEPDAARNAVYLAAIARQQRLYDRLIDR